MEVSNGVRAKVKSRSGEPANRCGRRRFLYFFRLSPCLSRVLIVLHDGHKQAFVVPLIPKAVTGRGVL